MFIDCPESSKYASIACQRIRRAKQSFTKELPGKGWLGFDRGFFFHEQRAGKQGFMKILSAHIVSHHEGDGQISQVKHCVIHIL